MTTPGGPPTPAHQPAAPPTGPAPAAPQGWPPNQAGWPPNQAGWPPAGPPRPPVVEGRDQTARVIGIIALVVGGITLLAQVAMLVFPFFLFGGLMLGSEGAWVEDGPLPMSNSSFSGRVSPEADGSVSGIALRDGLVRAAEDTGALDRDSGRIRCDDVRRVAPDVSVLCRAADGDRWYAVVRFTDPTGSFDVATLSDVEDEW